nr:PIPO [Tomato mild mottle virus]UQZ09763.1 PIPO [Tomato mild mottle virus]
MAQVRILGPGNDGEKRGNWHRKFRVAISRLDYSPTARIVFTIRLAISTLRWKILKCRVFIGRSQSRQGRAWLQRMCERGPWDSC